jgi:hypothetical protein
MSNSAPAAAAPARRRPVGDIVAVSFFVLMSVIVLGVFVAMGYGMLLDGAAYLLPIPIVLGAVALVLVIVTVTELVTDNAVKAFRRLRARIRTFTQTRKES